MGPKINDLNPIVSKITRPVAAIKFPRLAWSIISGTFNISGVSFDAKVVLAPLAKAQEPIHYQIDEWYLPYIW